MLMTGASIFDASLMALSLGRSFQVIASAVNLSKIAVVYYWLVLLTELWSDSGVMLTLMLA